MCSSGHSSHYGALGAYKSSAVAQPSAATIDGHLSNKFPSVFNHVGLKMGDVSQGTAYPSISASGPNKQLPFQCNPEMAYRNLFGSIASGGDIKAKYTRTGNVLDAMSDDIRKLQNNLPGEEREKLGHYLSGFEALKDRRIKLIGMQETLRKQMRTNMRNTCARSTSGSRSRDSPARRNSSSSGIRFHSRKLILRFCLELVFFKEGRRRRSRRASTLWTIRFEAV